MKEVYILKCTHVESNPRLTSAIPDSTLNILNLTYKLAMEIGLAKKPESFFADGHDENFVAESEDYLREVRNYESTVGAFLKMGMKQMLQENHRSDFQCLWFRLFYGSLQDAGVNIALKPTDIGFREFKSVLGPAIFREWCLLTGTDPRTVTPEIYQRDVLPLETRYRDEYIHRKIRKTGTHRNLLVIGKNHPLDSLLSDPEFRGYAVTIEHTGENDYRVHGALPKDLNGMDKKLQEETHDLGAFLGLAGKIKIEDKLEYK